ncbi:DUF3093 domain-containing protein [Nocardioides sp.]|uniref:DUF3093 domain-containing protein n=1 Tax=Nocardioides sp. TaxID=35761 RepID=UPI0035177374
MSARSQAEYRERLRVPLRWWAQGTMLIATFWLAMVVALAEKAPLLPWVITAALLLLLAAFLRSYGGAPVVVHDGWFVAGHARIEVRHLGEAEALDAEQSNRVAGRDADVRAYLLLRPYLRRSVRVPITDPDDPVPYWLVSSRHPRALAGALNEARARHGSPDAADH